VGVIFRIVLMIVSKISTRSLSRKNEGHCAFSVLRCPIQSCLSAFSTEEASLEEFQPSEGELLRRRLRNISCLWGNVEKFRNASGDVKTVEVQQNVACRIFPGLARRLHLSVASRFRYRMVGAWKYKHWVTKSANKS
jgi:hypothetical protein